MGPWRLCLHAGRSPSPLGCMQDPDLTDSNSQFQAAGTNCRVRAASPRPTLGQLAITIGHTQARYL